ncbi:MAG: mandelate racemase/muconate lactonizing enzyme family protein [Opitutaceae bacterium]
MRDTPYLNRALTRRTFLRRAGKAAATLALPMSIRATRPTTLRLTAATVPDPDGHHAALRLKGDWLVIAIDDGVHTGLGEVSHSNDDDACRRRVAELFAAHVAGREPSLELLEELHRGPFARASDLPHATAISGIDQALHDLVARRRGLPVWRLHAERAVRESVPSYLSTNRALRRRLPADFVAVVDSALRLGVRAVKLTPFEAVKPDGDQVAQAEEGFTRIAAVRAAHPDLSLRVDCHERFTPATAARLLPRFDEFKLTWLEDPCPPGPDLAALRTRATMPFAVGELFFGEDRFRELLRTSQAHVIMPDPKHVGGFGPLIRVCRRAEELGGEVSPHNPSGPIGTLACVHAAAVSRAVTSVELILTSDPARQPGRELLRDGQLRIPDGPGWGIDLTALSAATGAQFRPIGI